jgi:hypothetical protein
MSFFKVCDLIIIPLAGVMILSLVAIVAILGLQSTAEPMLKWPVLILNVVVIPYLTKPFFIPLIKHIKERKGSKNLA